MIDDGSLVLFGLTGLTAGAATVCWLTRRGRAARVLGALTAALMILTLLRLRCLVSFASVCPCWDSSTLAWRAHNPPPSPSPP